MRLTNHLDQPTNLHTHGLRVSPQGNSDNPFVRVDPGASFDYLAGSPPTTRPARTGTTPTTTARSPTSCSVAWPVPCSSTAARRAHRRRPGPARHRHHPRARRLRRPVGPADRMRGREGALVLVNGQQQPVCRPFPGRPSAGGSSTGAPPGCSRCAWKGTPLGSSPRTARSSRARPPDRLVLAPGNRADGVVSRAGRAIRVVDRSLRPRERDVGGMKAPVRRSRTPWSPPSPARRARPAATFRRRCRRRPRAASRRPEGGGSWLPPGGPAGPMAVTIDGRAFDPARTTRRHGRHGGGVDGPQLRPARPPVPPARVAVHGAPDQRRQTPTGVPQDVVLVPPGGWVRLRIPFTT